MESIEERLERVHRVRAKIKEKRDELILIAIRDTGFTHREFSGGYLKVVRYLQL